MQNLSCENEFYLHENKKNHFQINSFAFSFALKQGFGPTQKWPIKFTKKSLSCVETALGGKIPETQHTFSFSEINLVSNEVTRIRMCCIYIVPFFDS